MSIYLENSLESFKSIFDVIAIIYQLFFSYYSLSLILLIFFIMFYSSLLSRDFKEKAKSITIRLLIVLIFSFSQRVTIATKPVINDEMGVSLTPEKTIQTYLQMPVALNFLISVFQRLTIMVEKLLYLEKHLYAGADIEKNLPKNLNAIKDIFTLNKDLLSSLTQKKFEGFMNFLVNSGIIEKNLISKKINENNIYYILENISKIEEGGFLKFRAYDWSNNYVLVKAEDEYYEQIITFNQIYNELKNDIQNEIDAKMKQEAEESADYTKLIGYAYKGGSAKDILFATVFANSYSPISQVLDDNNLEQSFLQMTSIMSKRRSSFLEYKTMSFFSQKMIDIYLIITILLYPFIYPLVLFRKGVGIFFRYILSYVAYSVWIILLRIIDFIFFIFVQNDLQKAIAFIPFAANPKQMEGILASFSVYPLILTLLYPSLLATVMFLFNGTLAGNLLQGSSENIRGDEYGEMIKGNMQYDSSSFMNTTILSKQIDNTSIDTFSQGTNVIGAYSHEANSQLFYALRSAYEHGSENLKGYLKEKFGNLGSYKTSNEYFRTHDEAKFSREGSALLNAGQYNQFFGELSSFINYDEFAKTKEKFGAISAFQQRIQVEKPGYIRTLAETIQKTYFKGVSFYKEKSENTSKGIVGKIGVDGGGLPIGGSASISANTSESQSISYDELMKGLMRNIEDSNDNTFDYLKNVFDQSKKNPFDQSSKTGIFEGYNDFDDFKKDLQSYLKGEKTKLNNVELEGFANAIKVARADVQKLYPEEEKPKTLF